MKKALAYLTFIASLTACTPELQNETKSIVKSSATAVSSVYLNSAKKSVTNVCMEKYKNSYNCKCMTNKVIDSLSLDDVKYLSNKLTKKTSVDELASDNVIGQRVVSAQIECMLEKLYK